MKKAIGLAFFALGTTAFSAEYLMHSGSIPGLSGLMQEIGIAERPAFASENPLAMRGLTAPEDIAVISKTPLAFEPNQGQANPGVDFISRGAGYNLLLTPRGLVFSFLQPNAVRPTAPGTSASPPQPSREVAEAATLRMELANANARPAKAGIEELPGKVNYFSGRNPENWKSGLATFSKVRYQDVYPGIDLVYYGSQRQLEYDFIVAPGADPRMIDLRFTGRQLEVDTDGNLVFTDAEGMPFRLRKPVLYQEIDGARHEVAGGYVVDGNRVSFEVAAYDDGHPLVIDPKFDYSVALSGGNGEAGYAIAVDAKGYVYVTGETAGGDFPLANPAQKALGGSIDVFVTKLSPDGSQVLYSTYIGGSGADVGYGIAIDPAGNAYVTGDTRSADFPLVNPIQKALAGASDLFVTKLSADGSKILYSTFIGGSAGDRGLGIAVDSAGNAHVAGYTHSTDFPTANPVQPNFAGGNADGIVLKLNPEGSALVYSTYLGGGNDRPDLATSIALDPAANAYVTGMTNSPDFPTRNPAQPFKGPTDAFVTKFAPDGKIVYSTHLGGTADDEAMGIAVDAAGSAYVTGHTESLNFPTTKDAFSTSCVAVPAQIAVGNICSGGDAFVTKLSPDGSSIVYSTYLNGKGFEVGRSIAVDSTGNAYVTGFTGSENFVTANPVQKAFGGDDFDAFVVKLNPTGTGLVYSTYLGGSGEDGAYGIAVDAANNAYVTGYTKSTDFGTRNTLAGAAQGRRDGYVVKISDQATPQ